MFRPVLDRLVSSRRTLRRKRSRTPPARTRLLLEPLEDRIVPAIGVDFRQAANNDGGFGLGNIHWINSIVQSSNSIYFENMSVAQRVVAGGDPGTNSAIPATPGNL